MNRLALITLSLIPLLGGTAAQAADVEQGKKLVSEHCQRCHGSEVYTRPDHKVTSLPGLSAQVRRCEQMLGLTWFDDDIENTATYLNQAFYKFKK
jgi:mono/diheme cytochrome c family protein